MQQRHRFSPRQVAVSFQVLPLTIYLSRSPSAAGAPACPRGQCASAETSRVTYLARSAVTRSFRRAQRAGIASEAMREGSSEGENMCDAERSEAQPRPRRGRSEHARVPGRNRGLAGGAVAAPAESSHGRAHSEHDPGGAPCGRGLVEGGQPQVPRTWLCGQALDSGVRRVAATDAAGQRHALGLHPGPGSPTRFALFRVCSVGRDVSGRCRRCHRIRRGSAVLATCSGHRRSWWGFACRVLVRSPRHAM